MAPPTKASSRKPVPQPPAPPDPHPDQELSAALGWLTDSWCDRRALTALRYLLPAYPVPPADLTQGETPNPLQALLIALKDVRAFAREELTEPEHLLINDCVLALDRKLHPH